MNPECFIYLGLSGFQDHGKHYPGKNQAVNAVQDTATICTDLGHEVVEASPDVSGEVVGESFMTIWCGGLSSTLDTIAFIAGDLKPDQLEPITWALYEEGKQVSASDYLRAITILQRISRDIARFFVDYDVLLTPTLSQPPVPLGTFDATPENPLQGMDRAAELVPFTPIFNVTGQPAMSVPLFWNNDNLPVGSHFVGRFGDEATLFRLASQLEEARPWADHRPPIWG